MRLEVEQTAAAKRVFSQDDFDRFADLSGDDNPIHVDPDFSAKTRFGRTVCHGMLLYSTICQVVHDKLPGSGPLQLEQSLMFPTPTYTEEEMTIHLRVIEVRTEDETAVLETIIEHADGRVACQGQCRIGWDVGLLEQTRLSNGLARPSEAETYKGLRLGDKALTSRLFGDRDLAEYASLTGDRNPLFSDVNFARQAGLSGPMIPGGLLGGLFSYLLGTKLPGRGTNWLKQKLVFLQPAYPGQQITAEVEITRLRPEKELVNLHTQCLNPSGQVICNGQALVLVADVVG